MRVFMPKRSEYDYDYDDDVYGAADGIHCLFGGQRLIIFPTSRH